MEKLYMYFIHIIFFMGLYRNSRAESPPHFCLMAKPGWYCTPGLFGYRQCKQGEIFPVYGKCKKGYYCACGFNRKCSDGQHPGGRKEICVKHDNPGAIEKSFSTRLHGFGYIFTPQYNEMLRVSGVVYQDANAEKLCVKYKMTGRSYNKEITYLYLFDPSSDYHKRWHKFTIVKLNGNTTCRKSKQYFFPEFFEKLRKYAYSKNDKKWEYIDGPLHQNDRYRYEEWVLHKNGNGKVFPYRYKLVKHGSSNSKDTLRMSISYYHTFFRKPHDAWFNIPKYCSTNGTATKKKKEILNELTFVDEQLDDLDRELKTGFEKKEGNDELQ